MTERTDATVKKTVIRHWDSSKKFWMSPTEYTGVVAGKQATGGEYVITDGIIGPGGFIPDHYHKWEDQTFHIIEGVLEAKIGAETVQLGSGDSVHCPRGCIPLHEEYRRSHGPFDQLYFPRRLG